MHLFDVRSQWRGHTLLAVAGAVLALTTGAVGCGGDDTTGGTPQEDGGTHDGAVGLDGGPTPDGGGSDSGGTLGNGTIGTIGTAANGADFTSPFDATPDLDGTNVYFTAIDANGAPAVFKAPAAGGSVTKLAAGDPLVAPFGITLSSDGKTLYVADPGAGTNDMGQIFALSVSGGTPTGLSGTDGTAPRAVQIVADQLYFSGTDAASGKHGIFKIPASGGALTTIVSGLADPSGVAVTSGGDVYVLDTISTSRTAIIYKVTGGNAAPFAVDLNVGYPAGIALSQDQSALLVSALDPNAGTDVVFRFPLAGGNASSFNTGISSYVEPAGIHRAQNADKYAWADSLAKGTGTVFVLSK